VKGSVPGSTKRLIRIRSPIRPPNYARAEDPVSITYVSTSSKN
jgi:hypothetical protein